MWKICETFVSELFFVTCCIYISLHCSCVSYTYNINIQIHIHIIYIVDVCWMYHILKGNQVYIFLSHNGWLLVTTYQASMSQLVQHQRLFITRCNRRLRILFNKRNRGIICRFQTAAVESKSKQVQDEQETQRSNTSATALLAERGNICYFLVVSSASFVSGL